MLEIAFREYERSNLGGMNGLTGDDKYLPVVGMISPLLDDLFDEVRPCPDHRVMEPFKHARCHVSLMTGFKPVCF